MKKETKKRNYTAPKLKKLGTVKNLTRAAGGSVGDIANEQIV